MTYSIYNVITLGTPGSGKILPAKHIPPVLPALSFDESLECSKIYGIMGFISRGAGLVNIRSFRWPHHTL